MKIRLLGLLSAALFVIASVVTSTATFATIYQPRTPKVLKK